MVRGRPCCTGVPSLVNVDPEQIQRARAAAGCFGHTVLGFRDFLLKGKIVDLAVAVVIGGATLNLVNALVADIITPLIAAIAGQPNFATLTFTVHRSKFAYGDLINKILTFLFTCLIVYYGVVLPVSKLAAYFFPPTTCPECMETISAKAVRCKFCCIPIQPPIKTRKVTLADDDAEMIVPLKDYNPGTNRKISSHVTATAKSTGINTPNSQLGDAYHPAHFHQVQAYQAHLPADDAV